MARTTSTTVAGKALDRQPPAEQAATETGAPAATEPAKQAYTPGRASTVKLESAVITNRLVANVSGFPVPKGLKLHKEPFEQLLSQPLWDDEYPNNPVATLRYNADTLAVERRDGTVVDLVKRQGEDFNFDAYADQFREMFGRMTPAEATSLTREETQWEATSTLSGAGTAGRMLSVEQATSELTTGIESDVQLKTFDTATGKRVRLDELLSGPQFQAICAAVKSALPKLAVPEKRDRKGNVVQEAITGANFNPAGKDLTKMVDVRKVVANNFALNTDKNGKTTITVAWNGEGALTAQNVRFTFTAPTDARIK